MDGIRGIGNLPLSTETPELARPAGGTSFADLLGKAVGKVDSMQLQADGEAEKLALGGGNLHETALALEKADVALRVMTRVRNKVLEAYQEVMKMTV
jgi:flagellar hook-basal body complex protein FliE